MTRKRQAVFEALREAKSPASASDIARCIGGSCDLATIYRALHRLEEEGLAESFAFECKERGVERYYLARSSPHRHFFHCESCHRFIDLGECRLGALVAGIENEHGLTIESHALYFTGRCADCGGDGRNAQC